MNQLKYITGFLPAFFCLLFLNTDCHAAKPKRPGFEHKAFRISVNPRTPNQLYAFYSARGFPESALAEIKSMCFVTVGIRNKSQTRVWFDLENWHFQTSDGDIKRRLRSEWYARWNSIGMEKRFQSTFRWTLIPEKMGLYPHEGEGGNVTLFSTDKAITISGTIQIGEDKSQSVPFEIKNIQCARD